MASSGRLLLAGKVCIVTGATRGVGKGIALQLGEAGATVYITGRTLEAKPNDAVGGSLRETAKEIENRGGACIAIQCDHSKDGDIHKLFERVKGEQNDQLDLLVNNAYPAVNAIAENMGEPFWEQPLSMWDTVNNVGLRNYYLCSVEAAKMMVPKKRGVMVNVSSGGGLRYLFNVCYGVGKEACDRMAADCAFELKKHNVTFVSLWPGPVKTENIVHLLDSMNSNKGFNIGFPGNIDAKELFLNGESIEFPGKAVVSLASDPNVIKKTGRILLTAELGQEYGFKDIDGTSPPSMREASTMLTFVPKLSWLSYIIPSFVKVPFWIVALGGSKF